jgi:hypothetical protein
LALREVTRAQVDHKSDRHKTKLKKCLDKKSKTQKIKNDGNASIETTNDIIKEKC